MLNTFGAKVLRLILVFGAALLVTASIWQFDSSAADNSSSTSKFGPKWQALIGEWKGQDNSGTCGFHFDLGEHVIVRTNLATLAGTTAPHSDLMIISADGGGDKGRAAYWDNEGHVIEYTASWSTDGNTLTFLSKPGPGPQFRLIYKKSDGESFTVNFEMASPGQSTFRSYASGKITRR